MKVFCDDGSTNVKLAWMEGKDLKTAISGNSFCHGWKVEGLGSGGALNYQVADRKYSYDPVSEASITTTHVDYQYTDANLLAIHTALLNSGLEPTEIDLTVTLPISEFYTSDCQKNMANIERKVANVSRSLTLNKRELFTIASVDVMPEALPAVFSRLARDNVGQYEKSLVIDLGGTTMDTCVIMGQFESVSAVHGNPKIGVSLVTNPTLSALKMAYSSTSPMMANELIKNRNNNEFVNQFVNDVSKKKLVLDTIEEAILDLGSRVVDDLSQFRSVNRVYILGGGGPLIYAAVQKAWSHLGDKVVLIDNPQTALVHAMAQIKTGD
ncbi:plasmid segregation protein ParM domain-containing protein [Pectobacterium brasiliense]|uniref:plasmid segregation protein ParM domain-containing protein n=1 Tax=Pectobacterium brasiliense TaxID=180957 RepID=UPI0019693923|nr:plasmid segregation protein ParM domain-containing protein [Pectobacterium brasiliense]MBN3263018.1 StbA family protein [Pectobacterium brasiliense]